MLAPGTNADISSLTGLVENALEGQATAWDGLNILATRGGELGACARAARRACAILTGRSMVRDEIGDAGTQEAGTEPGPADAAVLIRQLVRLMGQNARVEVPMSVANLVQDAWPMASLVASAVVGGRMSVQARDFVPDGQSARPEAIAAFDVRPVPRRADSWAVADAVLRRWTDFKSYQSPVQKEALHAMVAAPEHAVLLVSLPTGGGKSLCAQLPTLHWTRGGGMPGQQVGCTIVIVPTIALALDQEQSARALFKNRPDAVVALTGDSPRQARDHALSMLAAGQLPLLYLSPEMALGEALGPIQACARAGHLRALVMDEAHLVETWGAKFRPGLQRLGNLRKELTVDCPSMITLLLSATVTPAGEERLKRLFLRGSDPYRHVDGRSIRPEHDYVITTGANKAWQEKAVMAALSHLPRPALLYVTLIDEAQAWLDRLQLAGFARVRSFTGATPPAERRAIIDLWRSDGLDLVVATSAFGLGIDKPDVRAVVHATLPESLDRYYQEVGRSGRDGCAATSVLIATPEDKNPASHNALGGLLTTELAVLRWLAMWRNSTAVEATPGNCVRRIDLNTRAKHVEAQTPRSGLRNLEWNEGTLLLLERAGLIEPWVLSREHEHRDFVVADPDLMTSEDRLLEVLEPHRATEQKENLRRFQSIAQLAQDPEARCVVTALAESYGLAGQGACGRCPYCRKAGLTPADAHVTARYPTPWGDPPCSERELSSNLKELVGPYRRGVIEWPTEWSLGADPRKIRLLLDTLCASGVDQFLVPDEWVEGVLRGLESTAEGVGIVVPHSARLPDSLENLTTAVLLRIETDERRRRLSDGVFEACESAAHRFSPERPLLYLLPTTYRRLGDSPDRRLVEMIPCGGSRDAESLV